ncbi:MAG: sulfatase-like hydrolase/transferase [Planctomycetaceae bacterium]|nr:sulfatase-like hydrolase/transferase [Planctomycetaceae bacterium]
MTIRFLFYLAVIISGLFYGVVHAEDVAKQPPPKYNLLFIMTDQHRYDVLGAAGNPVVKTPNLDALAADGVRFTSAYTPCPVCSPARTSILTGRSIFSTGTDTNAIAQKTPPDLPVWKLASFDAILNQRGYFSEYHGKWHSPIILAGISKTTDKSFYHNFGYAVLKDNGTFRYGNDEKDALSESIRKNAPFDIHDLKDGLQYEPRFLRPYAPVATDIRYGKPSPKTLNKNVAGKNTNDEEEEKKNGVVFGKLLLDAKFSQTSFQRDLSLKSLDDALNSGKPFNVTASFSFPHPPYVVTEPYFSLYRDENNRPVKELDALISPNIDDHSYDSPYSSTPSRRLHYCYDRKKITDFMSVYYALTTEVDESIGRLIQKLKENGEYNNTLIIYTSDHGEMLGAHGRNGKGVFYEESVRVPLIVKLPKGEHAGLVVDRLVSTRDLFSTILDYAIADTQTVSEGQSLRTVIENPQTANWNDYEIIEWSHKNAAAPSYCVVSKDWKLMLSRSDKAKSALYDLKNDPNELVNLLAENNLLRQKEYRRQKEILKSNLLEFLQKTGHTDYENIKTR